MRRPVRWLPGVTQPEIIGLDSLIPFTGSSFRKRLDQGQHPARWITRSFIRVHRNYELVLWGLSTDSVQGFSISRVGFASERETHASLGHQVTFVSRINEHFGMKNFAVLHHDPGNARVFLLDGNQPLLKVNRDL